MPAILHNEENLFTGNDPNENFNENISLPSILGWAPSEIHYSDPLYYSDHESDTDSDDEDFIDKRPYNLFSPKIKLTHVSSLLLNRDINYNDIVSFRIDNYSLNEYLHRGDILYYKFLSLITPNIKDYILKFVSIGDKPIKLSFILTGEKLKRAYRTKLKNFRLIEPILIIYFSHTKEIKENLDGLITRAINAEGYTDHDWIYSREKNNLLNIIQERLTVPRNMVEENGSPHVFLSKTFKENKCIICQENNSNILFCDCGHKVICDECFHKLNNGKCPKCRTVNKIIRKI